MPSAYLFDMDGLLLDTERLILNSFLDCAPEFDLDLDAARDFYLTLVGVAGAESERRLEAFLGGRADVSAVRRQWRAHADRRLAAGVPLRPTVVETLRQLEAEDAVMAVVTSTQGARARHHLEEAGLLSHFEFVLGGDEVSANKPEPAPYLEAAARFGVAPQRCAAFEDSDSGTTAAVRAGCHVVQIPDLRPAGRPLPQLGQLVAESLQQAVPQVQQKFRTTIAGAAG